MGAHDVRYWEKYKRLS